MHTAKCPDGCTRHASRCPQRVGGGLELRRPKGKSRRQITMPPQLVAALRKHRETQHAEREHAGSEWEERDLVFTLPTGRPVDPRRDWDEWKELLKAAGVRDVRVHDGRHSAGTLLIAQGIRVRTAQEILGHSDVRTAQGYTHLASEVARDAAQRMGGRAVGVSDV